MMRLLVSDRVPVTAVEDGSAPLNVRIRRLHQRRRRAVVRRLLKGAVWSAGLLGGVAFALAEGVGLVQR
jgi:hypothetical protein